MDIEIMPYNMLLSSQFAMSGRKGTGSLKLEKVIIDAVNSKTVKRVSLYVNTTQFVDAGNNVAKVDLRGADIKDISSVSLVADVPTLVPSQGYVYARIGLKILGVPGMIYTPIQKLTF
jgi:ABC-type lipoprotein release transport system permease subunit